MKDGFVKVAAATPAIRVADCAYNAAQIETLMRSAADQGVSLLALPELCITGYTCGDLFLQSALLDGARAALRRLIDVSARLPLAVAVGLPLARGNRLYNCAAVFCRGELLGVVPKTHLPNYGEFYERRHFSPAPQENASITVDGRDYPFGPRLLFCCRALPAFQFAVEICEDLWVPCSPSETHVLEGATVILNLSASDETIGKAEYRRQLVSSQSAKLLCGYLYADAGEGESTTDLVFGGHNLIAENGAVLAETPPFTGGMAVTELDVCRLEHDRRRMTSFPEQQRKSIQIPFDLPLTKTALTRPVARHPFVPQDERDRAARCEAILAIQAAGLQKRMEHTGCKKLVIGVSGGLDSTLAVLAAIRALDRMGRPHADLLAITMPCFGTTARTKGNAELLCERLGVAFRTVEIGASVTQHFRNIGLPPGERGAAFENGQARERTQVLMDLANLEGGLVIGTGDLSELALGWATYNGDHMSMYGINASIPKTLVRHLVRYEAERTGDPDLRRVLLDILDTPVSPELLPAEDGEITQITEELVGPYELHDFFLYHVVRFGFGPAKVLRLAEYAFAGAYPRDTLLHWLKTFYCRFFSQQFKRSCLPDGPKVGSVSLSPRGDWRMPSDASAALWLSELEQL